MPVRRFNNGQLGFQNPNTFANSSRAILNNPNTPNFLGSNGGGATFQSIQNNTPTLNRFNNNIANSEQLNTFNRSNTLFGNNPFQTRTTQGLGLLNNNPTSQTFTRNNPTAGGNSQVNTNINALGSAGDSNRFNSDGVLNTISNVAQLGGEVASLVNRQNTNVPGQQTTPGARSTLVNANAEIANINEQERAARVGLNNVGTTQAINQSLRNSRNTNVSRALENVRNTNADILNQASQFNVGNARQNASVIADNLRQVFAARNANIAETNAAISSIGAKLGAINADRRRQQLARRQQAVDLASSDPRAVDFLRNNLGQANNTLNEFQRAF